MGKAGIATGQRTGELPGSIPGTVWHPGPRQCAVSTSWEAADRCGVRARPTPTRCLGVLSRSATPEQLKTTANKQ